MLDQVSVSQKAPASSFDQLGEGIWKVDHSGRTTYVNQKMTELLGYEREEMLLRPLWDFLDDQSKETAIEHGKLPKHEVPNRVEVGFVCKNGNCIRTLVSTSEESDGAFAIVTSIQEQVEREQRLKLQKEAAVAQVQSKTQFLANMSHEIRTPLNSILGFAELLRDETLDPEKRQQFVNIICRAGEILRQVVDDILDFSKLESGAPQVKLAPFSLPELLADTFRLFSQRVIHKGIQLEIFCEGTVSATVVSDHMKVQQILNNLISNAIKFTNCGGITVSIQQQPHEKPRNAWLEVIVKDSGVGIAKEDQGRLFQEYSQVGSSLTGDIKGTGIGLALSRKLCEVLGGKVYLKESDVGIGSSFAVKLPVHANGGPTFVERWSTVNR